MFLVVENIVVRN